MLDIQYIGNTYHFKQCNQTHLHARIEKDNTNRDKGTINRVRKTLSGIPTTNVGDMDQAVFKAYTKLIGLSLKLKIRQDLLPKDPKKNSRNPFNGAAFYEFNNFNATNPSEDGASTENTMPSRIDYSENYLSSFSSFTDEAPKEFNGVLSKDLTVVRYHGPLSEENYKWFMPAMQANQLQEIEHVKNKAAILNAYGAKTHVTIATIPAGEQVRFLHGKAEAQHDPVTGELRPGGATQYCFYDFDSKWICETRKIPVGHGYNNLILGADDIEKLTMRDICIKIHDLDSHTDYHFKTFPLGAQLALLDLAFNGRKVHKDLLVGKKWDYLAQNPHLYPLKELARKKQIQQWFFEAAKLSSMKRSF